MLSRSQLPDFLSALAARLSNGIYPFVIMGPYLPPKDADDVLILHCVCQLPEKRFDIPVVLAVSSLLKMSDGGAALFVDYVCLALDAATAKLLQSLPEDLV